MASSKYSLSLVFVISVLCGSCVHAVELKGDSKLRSNRHKFNWGKTHGWHFQPPISGEEQRYLNWKVNNDEMKQHNVEQDEGLWTYRKGLNFFADKSFQEIERYYLSSVMPIFDSHVALKFLGTAVPTFDWRGAKGWKIRVKNQGRCAAGWAFATVTSFEFHYFNVTGRNIVLSTQELIDCAPTLGCLGGSALHALRYIRGNGLRSFRRYPDNRYRRKCTQSNLLSEPTIRSPSFHVVHASNAESLKIAISTRGPVIAHVHVTMNFIQYESGVFYDDSCAGLVATNHAVVIMGYGTDPAGGPYWLILNSWGIRWGENGYMRITQSKKGNCGITTFPVFPTVSVEEDL